MKFLLVYPIITKLSRFLSLSYTIRPCSPPTTIYLSHIQGGSELEGGGGWIVTVTEWGGAGKEEVINY